MEYAWEIVKLGVKDQENVDGDILEGAIVEVKWRKTATNLRGQKSNYIGKTILSAENVSSSDFINEEDLTEEQILTWVKNSIGPVQEQVINETLAKRIDKQEIVSKNPAWV